MKKIIQIVITEEEIVMIDAYSQIIRASERFIDAVDRLPKLEGNLDGLKRWRESLKCDAIGLRNLARNDLGEALVKLQLSRGKIL